MKKRKGQVTIFIIVAIVIVLLAALLYIFYPQIRTGLGLGSQSPSAFLQSCLEEDVEMAIDTLSIQGGSIEPENYFMYNGEKVEYLCYTTEYYKTCVMQQPLLKEHIEKEIGNEIEVTAKKCFDDLESSYRKRGYSVNLKRGRMAVELLPKRVVVNFDSSLSLSKGEVENYNSFNVVVNNNLYELVAIAKSILNFEARYGDSETTVYMNYYRDLKVEKKKQSEGTTIYILTDRNDENKFQFASRSLAWPPGYVGSTLG